MTSHILDFAPVFIQQMIAWLLYVLGALRGTETTEMNVVVFILQDMTI